jgi:cytochrome c5
MKAVRACLAVLLLALGSPAAPAADDENYPLLEGKALVRGRTVWLGTCRACHGEGFADAPAVADKAAWAPRVAKGKALLYQHALEGFFGSNSAMMPPRGGNPQLSDEEVRLAVDYMVALVSRQPSTPRKDSP